MGKLLAFLAAAVLLAPIYFMFTGSLQQSYGLLRIPPALLPPSASMDNYRRLFDTSSLSTWVLNSVVAVGGGVLLSLFVCLSAGYALTLRFRGRRIVMTALLLALTVPRTAILMPAFVEVCRLGLMDTLWAIILPAGLYPVGIVLAKLYIETIPVGMCEEARLAGAGEWRVLFQVIAPQCRPIVGLICLFQGVALMGDYVWQMMVLPYSDNRTLAVGLVERAVLSYVEMYPNPLGMRMAAGVVLFAPLAVIYCVASRYFTENPIKGVTSW